MRDLPTSPTQLAGPIAVSLLVVLCLVSPADYLMYESSKVTSEPWRLITANILHTNSAHLILNLSGISILWLLHGNQYTWMSYLFVVATTAVGTTLGLLLFPEITWYVGLSGVLHGLLVWGIVQSYEQQKTTSLILGIGLVVKLLIENLYGRDALISEWIGAAVITEAHLTGTLTGIVIAVIYRLLEFNKQTDPIDSAPG